MYVVLRIVGIIYKGSFILDYGNRATGVGRDRVPSASEVHGSNERGRIAALST